MIFANQSKKRLPMHVGPLLRPLYMVLNTRQVFSIPPCVRYRVAAQKGVNVRHPLGFEHVHELELL